MDYNNNAQHSPGGGKSHVCNKCGWNYPNPHPSAKNRRAHKKICGIIKGFEILGSDQNLDLQKEHCLDDEQKPPSPRVVDERNGDISEEDVFADAICEFSSSVSIKEKEEERAAKCNPGETQHCNKSPEVVQESLDVLLPVQVLENFPSSAEAAETCGESSSSDSLIEQSREAQVIHDGRTISNVELKTECKGNVADESESMLAASALGKRVDTSASSWNDEVIYSDLEGPHGFAFSVEDMNMNPPGEADYTAVSDKNPVDTETAHVSLHGTKLPLEDLSIGREVPSPEKTEHQGQLSLVALKESPNAMPKIDPEDIKMKPDEGESSFGASQETVESETVRTAVDPIVAVSNADECHSETIADQVINTGLSALDAIPFAENVHVPLHGTKGLEDKLPSENLSIGREVPSPDKTEPHGHTCLVAVKEFPSVENIVMSKIDLEDSKIKAESPFGASQSETVTSAVNPIVVVSNADVSHSDLTAPESELIQANVVAEENSTISELSSQSSCAVKHHVSPVSVVLEGDEPSLQNKSSTETSKDSILQIGAEACESSDKEACTTPNPKLVERARTESNRVVRGLGVIQANEIDGNVKAHNNVYAEIPVTIESNDVERLQNLSEAHIRPLVLSPLVTRDHTHNAISGHSEPENESQWKNQEMTTSWSTGKEEHVPLKNLLNEARSPRLVVAEGNNIPRVSSILEQGTSPEEEGGWPERRDVSQEWNSPAKYPVERKVKGRPFWVPFVCCSSK